LSATPLLDDNMIASTDVRLVTQVTAHEGARRPSRGRGVGLRRVIPEAAGYSGIWGCRPTSPRPGRRRCTSSVMRLRLRSLALRRTPLTQPVPRQPARRAPQRPESRLTAAPRTGILDTMEACHPRVRGTNPPVGEGGERPGGSNIVYRLQGSNPLTCNARCGAKPRRGSGTGRSIPAAASRSSCFVFQTESPGSGAGPDHARVREWGETGVGSRFPSASMADGSPAGRLSGSDRPRKIRQG
jgi:hypothetical protein